MSRSTRPSRRAGLADATLEANRFRIHLLDVSRAKYGDALVLELGSRRILIDGAHPGDDKAKPWGAPSLPEQFTEIFGSPGPFRFDLLVITHAHLDHIGCLPSMVAAETISADWVLAADEELGWGGPALDGVADPRAAALLAGLREERLVFGSDAELEAYLADAMTLRQRYTKMLKTLADRGAQVLRYGRDELVSLMEHFADTGLEILGPTREHLEICRAAIEVIGRDALDFAAQTAIADSSESPSRLLRNYLELRGAVDQGLLGVDSSSAGNAINCQSIVLKVKRGDRKVLLTGDMQLADPRVPGLGPSMDKLRQAISDGGSYDMVKLPHHGAGNGFNASVLDETGAPLLTLSTGPGSAKHPHPNVLDLLRARSAQIQWLRTDRNGRLTIDYSEGDGEVTWQRGEANDLTPNVDPDGFQSEPNRTATAPGIAPRQPFPMSPASPAVAAAPVESMPKAISMTGENGVEVVLRLPNQPTRVTFTIEIQPVAGAHPPRLDLPHGDDPGFIPDAPALPSIRVGAGRPLPRLVFATDPDALAKAVGRAGRDAALQALKETGQPVVLGDFAGRDPARVSGEIIPEVLRQPTQGIVLVGGYDVIPSDIVNTLRPIYRKQVSRRNDPDYFCVWSDDIYGSIDDREAVADIPVSRIPDGHDPELLMRALGAARQDKLQVRAGLRNLLRPFAEEIFSSLPGTAPCLVSSPTRRIGFPNGGSLGADVTYLMLHGSHLDTATFHGNTNNEDLIEAFGLENVGECGGAVVFTGACWGALTVRTRAKDHDTRTAPAVRTAKDSIALAYLNRGANAFIGCTGAHYSPRLPPYDYASGPLHRYFFEALLLDRLSPAMALWRAKQRYAEGMLSYPNPVDPGGPGAGAGAIERKLYAEFTCLGLGW
jgi:beta-lactamase superfamily II metal-dependent hydrolase